MNMVLGSVFVGMIVPGGKENKKRARFERHDTAAGGLPTRRIYA